MPQNWKGGRLEAGKRYRESHRELLRERHRQEYARHKERYGFPFELVDDTYLKGNERNFSEADLPAIFLPNKETK